MDESSEEKGGTKLVVVDLGKLAKPAHLLVEKISAAIGKLYEPRYIRKVAEAEADAVKVRADAKMEVELRRRAVERFLAEEVKKQVNIESITAEALSSVGEESRPEEVDDDWIVNFFDQCRLVSDAEMQKLWASILSGEASSPGRYSKRTVNILGSMDRRDAEAFRAVCGFVLDAGRPLALIFDPNADVYRAAGVTLESLFHLEAVGLLRSEAGREFSHDGFPRRFVLNYFGERRWVTFPHGLQKVAIGRVVLTMAGQELVAHAGGGPQPGFLDYLCERWRGHGCEIQIEEPPRPGR